jgi:hypothetical protein
MLHYEEKAGGLEARGPAPNGANDESEHDGALFALDATDPVELQRALLVYGTAGQAARIGAQARLRPGMRAH